MPIPQVLNGSKERDPRYIFMDASQRWVRIGSKTHLNTITTDETKHPYSLIANQMVKYRKIFASPKLTDKQVKIISKLIIKNALCIRNTDVVAEIKELFNLDFQAFLRTSQRFRLGVKAETDISESETDWSDYYGNNTDQDAS